MEFSEFHYKNSQHFKRNLLATRLAPIAVLCVFLLVHIISPTSTALSVTILPVIFSIMALLWLFLSKKILPEYTIRKTVKSTLKEGKPPFGSEIRLEADEEGIGQYSEQSDLKVNYGSIDKIAQGKSAIYIYLNVLQAIILPHRAFESDTQRAEFLRFLQSKKGC